MSKADYYQTLGVNKSASASDIKKAYRKLAMKYHPDRNPGDEASEKKFKEISEAYEILKDDQKRAAYDSYGHQAFQNGAGGPGGFQGGGFEDFGDIFDNIKDMFGGFGGGASRKRSAAIRGSDFRYDLDITLKESYQGITKNISLNLAVKCGTCNGSGSKGGQQADACGNCNGSGKVRAQQGFFIVERTCGTCNGTGQVIKNPCGTCSGQGRLQKKRTLSVKIPAGIEDGMRIRLNGEGEAGLRGGANGDLYVFVKVKKHDFFERIGNDIICEVPIKMTTAALGGSVEVPIIDGSMAKIKIPEGAQSGNQFALRSKGMAVINSGGRRGDMFVKIFVETPVHLDSEQKKLIEKLDEMLQGNGEAKSQGYFEKVAEFFNDLKK